MGDIYVARVRGLSLLPNSLPTASAVGYWYAVGFADWSPISEIANSPKPDQSKQDEPGGYRSGF